MTPSKDNNQPNGEANEDLTFYVRIQYRRNTSWQGTIQCMNSRKSCVFRSVLELGYLIYSEQSTGLDFGENKDFKLPKWNEKEDVS